jgi:hypothetical protein
MRTIVLSWETWRAVIAVLREKSLPLRVPHRGGTPSQVGP